MQVWNTKPQPRPWLSFIKLCCAAVSAVDGWCAALAVAAVYGAGFWRCVNLSLCLNAPLFQSGFQKQRLCRMLLWFPRWRPTASARCPVSVCVRLSKDAAVLVTAPRSIAGHQQMLFWMQIPSLHCQCFDQAYYWCQCSWSQHNIKMYGFFFLNPYACLLWMIHHNVPKKKNAFIMLRTTFLLDDTI